jgi:hypothetical protein
MLNITTQVPPQSLARRFDDLKTHLLMAEGTSSDQDHDSERTLISEESKDGRVKVESYADFGYAVYTQKVTEGTDDGGQLIATASFQETWDDQGRDIVVVRETVDDVVKESIFLTYPELEWNLSDHGGFNSGGKMSES